MVPRLLRTPSRRINDEVVGAALELLQLEGPDGFTVRAIAKRANVAPMAIYNHFQGKNGLLEAIWIEGFVIMRDLLDAKPDSPLNPAQALLESGLAYRRFALDHRAHYTVMFLHHFENFVPSVEATQVAAQAFQILFGHIERCQEVGLFPDYAAADVAQMLWSACHGYVALEIVSVTFAGDNDATFKNLLNGLLRGLAVPSSSE